MSMLKVIVRTEALLLFRNKFLTIPLILNVIFWADIISYEMQDVHIQERAAVFYSIFIWVLLLNLLIMGLFSVYMASKDRESVFESLVMTYHVKNTEWIIGKWLAAQLYGLCITFITLFIQVGWFASSEMSLSDIIKNGIYVFVQMEGAFFIVISLGFLCGILIKNILAYILVAAILVLSLLLPFDYTGVAYHFDNPRLHLLTPFDYMFIESPYEGIWGIHRVFENTIVHQSAVFFLGIVIVLIALLFFYADRKIKKEQKLIPMLLVIFIISLFLLGGIRYTQYNQALEQYIDTGKMYIKVSEEEQHIDFQNSSLDHTKYDFSIEQMDLIVQLQSDNHIEVESNLTIKHHGNIPENKVKLTLYHGLEIKECSSESNVSCVRDKDFVTVHFENGIEPDEHFDLTLHYQGNILQYRDEGNIEHSFIEKNRIYLPKEADWYPLIGERQLIVAQDHDGRYLRFEQRNGRLIEDYPTEFTVKVLNEAGEIPLALTIPKIADGKFAGISQYGLSLVGGNVKETKVGEVRVIGHPEVLAGVKEKVYQYQQGWSFIENWLEVPVIPSVIYVLNREHAYLTRYTPSQEFLVWDEHNLTYMNDPEQLAYDLWNSFEGDTGFSFEIATDDQSYLSYQAHEYLRQAAIWIILSELDHVDNFKDWYLDDWRELDEDEEHLFTLLNLYAEKGTEEFKAVVKYLLTYVEQLEDKSKFNMEEALKLYEGESS